MTTYISLLRGINVGGNHIVPMKELKTVYENIGLENVVTYIQSGNVIFQSQLAENKLIEDKIGKAFKEKYGYEVSILVRTKDEWGEIVKGNPFADKTDNIKQLHISLMRHLPDSALIANLPLRGEQGDQIHVAGQTIYLLCGKGYADTNFTNGYFEKILKVPFTTRNWNTTMKLWDLCGK